MEKLKTLVISQQPMLREGIWHTLSANSNMEVACVSEITDTVLAEINESKPDIALVDIDGTADTNTMLVRRMKHSLPNIGIILLSADSNDNQLFHALKAQASAFLNKDVTADKLLETIKRVADGEQPIKEIFSTRQKVAMQVLHKFQELSWQMEEEENPDSPLTSRETEILNYVAQGYLNKQIATELGISEQTIKNHITSILRKLNAGARTEAVVVALKQGIITLS
ncbi:MAG: response regulator transcription factor [Dehalococcoidales bacterium]|nr:response regulator transcription factor [Dehalococcoidales bacterium]